MSALYESPLDTLSKSDFVKPAFALAVWFPEIDPIALLELIESPAVRLAFYEFQCRYWEVHKRVPSARVHIATIEKSFEDFNKNPYGFRLKKIGGGDCHNPEQYEVLGAFYAFMSRVYSWANSEFLGLTLRPFLADETYRLSIMWGVLGVCIAMFEEGHFPEPDFPLPTHNLDWTNDHERELFRQNATVWQLSTESMRHTPQKYPQWVEWRRNHASYKEAFGKQHLADTYAETAAMDYKYGIPENPTKSMGEWLQVIEVAKVWRSMQYHYEFDTKYCNFGIAQWMHPETIPPPS
ncbi:hypothetical protein F4808DRAFT_459632 [Astrocystis sublimbata]|nr:hypothetical protein F4808DRAFT_459632 [Astrocystis sublimbata]